MNPLTFTCEESPTVVYACGKCKNVVASTATFGNGPGSSREAFQLAFDHCEPRRCRECKEQIVPSHSLICDPCRIALIDKREAERFEKATKTPLHEYDGQYLYIDGCGQDGYFETEYVEEEIANALADGRTSPIYAYGCDPVSLPKLEAEQLVIDLCENGEMHEDAADQIEGIEELQQALDAWHAKQKVTSYVVDYKIAVDLTALLARLA